MSKEPCKCLLLAAHCVAGGAAHVRQPHGHVTAEQIYHMVPSHLKHCT